MYCLLLLLETTGFRQGLFFMPHAGGESLPQISTCYNLQPGRLRNSFSSTQGEW